MNTPLIAMYAPTNVVPLRRPSMATEPAIESEVPAATGISIADLAMQIEALSSRLIAAQAVAAHASAFDAIYLSALTPDLVTTETLERIKRFSRIEDRSGEIHFEDGLD